MHERNLFKRISLCNYEGWQVPRSTIGKLEIRRTSGRVLVQNSAGLRLKKSWCFSSSTKTGRKTVVPTQDSQAREISSYLQEVRIFFLFFFPFQVLTDWMKSAHIREGNLLYSDVILMFAYYSTCSISFKDSLQV